MFNEICIYEAKIEKQDEIEALMKEVAEFYLAQQGVLDVKYIKRTYRQKDDIIVEYATRGISNKIFVSKYQLYLPDKKVLQNKLKELLND
jgi:hypothetical protein